MSSKVFVVNKGPHNYAKAKHFGELVFMTEDTIPNTTDLSHMVRLLWPHLEKAKEGDYLLWSGLKNLNCIASMLFVLRVGRPRILIFTGRQYVPRDMDFRDLLNTKAFDAILECDVEKLLK